MRARAQSDTGVKSTVKGADSDETRRDKFQKPFPVKAGTGTDRELPQILPPTPPSEPESYSTNLQRSRSRSTPARSRSLAVRSSGSSTGSSEYTPPLRSRLDTVRDEEDDVPNTEMRRTKSTGGRGDRGMNRSLSTRTPRGRREDRDDLYDIYGDYYDEKPMTRTLTTRRPLARANTMSRGRGSSSSRNRRQDDEESQRYSDEEDDEFEMVTPKRSEITKVSSL